MIALDLDGTLLDSSKRLSAANRAALDAAAANGVLIVPSTGRFFGMMPQCIRELPFVRYAITVNGAQVYDSASDSAVVREEIPLSTAVNVMDFLDRYDVIYDCYRSNWGWMTQAFKDKAVSYATDAHYLKMIADFRNGVPELKAHLRKTCGAGNVQKIMLFANLSMDAANIAKIGREVAERFPSLKVTSSTWNNFEINSADAHKGVALKNFAAAMDIPIEETMAIGDGMNDLTMIEAAGFSVAMANAAETVKNAADYVTLSNDEDGVANVIQRFVL